MHPPDPSVMKLAAVLQRVQEDRELHTEQPTLHFRHCPPWLKYPVLQIQEFPDRVKWEVVSQLVHTVEEEQVVQPIIPVLQEMHVPEER